MIIYTTFLIIKIFFRAGTYIHTGYSGDRSVISSDTIASLVLVDRLHAFLVDMWQMWKSKTEVIVSRKGQKGITLGDHSRKLYIIPQAKLRVSLPE